MKQSKKDGEKKNPETHKIRDLGGEKSQRIEFVVPWEKKRNEEKG